MMLSVWSIPYGSVLHLILSILWDMSLRKCGLLYMQSLSHISMPTPETPVVKKSKDVSTKGPGDSSMRREDKVEQFVNASLVSEIRDHLDDCRKETRWAIKCSKCSILII